MDKMLASNTTGLTGGPDRTASTRRPTRGARSHPLVASLAGGLQATYAAQPEEAVAERFASLLARLDRGGAETR